MKILDNISLHHRRNLRIFIANPVSEISGSLGDLGTLLPILIAETLIHAISLPSTLVFMGFANIFTGVLFGIPLPVQPMKAIAAVAIANNFTREQNAAAGITVSTVVLVFSVTGLLNWFSRNIPIPVVKGIQVGAGLSLILSAGTSLLQPLAWTGPSWADNYIWALLAFFFLLFTAMVSTRIRIPYALIIVVLGLIYSSITLHQHHRTIRPPSIWHPHTYIPEPNNLWETLSASLGQLPLTTLNSIIAVSHLSADLLPEVPEPSSSALGISVATMNLVSCWFGSLPACHGSGGLAGQYRFGARSGASIIILGLFKIILGLFIGDSIIDLLHEFPKAFLGLMLAASGVELARVGESLNFDARDLWEESASGGKQRRKLTDEERMERWSVMSVTVAGLLAFRNDAIGFLAGLFWHWGLHASEYLTKWRRDRSWLGQYSAEAERHEYEDEALAANPGGFDGRRDNRSV